MEIMKASKQISYLLRHQEDFVDKNGWATVESVMRETKTTIEDIIYVVDNNDKKRFEFNEDKTLIRARQGHSVNVDVELKEVMPPSILYHGTKKEYIKSILKKGLVKMNRNHVHLSEDKITANIVAKRKKGETILLMINSKAMFVQGHKFYLSNNGVWLTDKVPPQYIN